MQYPTVMPYKPKILPKPIVEAMHKRPPTTELTKNGSFLWQRRYVAHEPVNCCRNMGTIISSVGTYPRKRSAKMVLLNSSCDVFNIHRHKKKAANKTEHTDTICFNVGLNIVSSLTYSLSAINFDIIGIFVFIQLNERDCIELRACSVMPI